MIYLILSSSIIIIGLIIILIKIIKKPTNKRYWTWYEEQDLKNK